MTRPCPCWRIAHVDPRLVDGGEHEDRQAAGTLVGLEGACHLESGPGILGEHHVNDDEIGAELDDVVDDVLVVVLGPDLVPVALEDHRDRLHDALFIVDDVDSLHDIPPFGCRTLWTRYHSRGRSATGHSWDSDTDIIALVGAGDRGHAILEALLRIPGIEVRYVFDADPAAPGVALARENGIRCRTDGRFDELSADADVDLILETTGKPEVLAALLASKHPNSCLLGAAGMRIISHLLDAQRQTDALLERQRRTFEQRIVELTDGIERANSEKARYLRQASHQLKSPLSSIQSYVNVILGGYTGEIPERTREIMEKIHSRCDAALDALDERRMLADLRCIDRDGLEMSTVRLSEVITQTVDRHAELARKRGIEIRPLPHDGPDLVHCDPQQMLTLLSELIENAVIYSQDRGLVEISLEAQRDGRLAVSIRDHGIGIPARCLPRIFDEDYRADPAVKHHKDGAGLGLAIAREIADLHQFDLAAESEEGHGSVFTLSVPLAPTA